MGGFNFDSTLGYPGEGPPTEVPESISDIFSPETEVWLNELEEEKRLIEQLPVVMSVEFVIGETSNLTKVKAVLSCCWDQSSRKFKRAMESCTDDNRKPTLLEAARTLRAKMIKDHMSASHTHDPRAIERCEALAQDQQEPTRG